jgi:urate oxidase / 2-oxo-4-hydroxy-4-carboxy-5-ureidoimidazoline decarboxylase
MTPMEIQYGKARVIFFRIARGELPPFAASVTIDVFGERFSAAYTEGDNREVVATDTMKNFVYASAADFDGRTLETYVAYLGRRLLGTYPQMERIRVTAHEIPLDQAHGDENGQSNVLFRLTRGDLAMSHADFERSGDSVTMRDVRCGIEGLRLLKTTGSSFARFARDEYTSLPELSDRPLTMRMDVHWRYAEAEAATDARRHVPVEQIRRSIEHTFHTFNSRSIQELVLVMGNNLLKGFPTLSEVEFAAENHTPDAVAEGKNGVRVFAEPRQTFGRIGLVLRR